MPNIMEKVITSSSITYSTTSKTERFIKQNAAVFCLASGSISIFNNMDNTKYYTQ